MDFSYCLKLWRPGGKHYLGFYSNPLEGLIVIETEDRWDKISGTNGLFFEYVFNKKLSIRNYLGLRLTGSGSSWRARPRLEVFPTLNTNLIYISLGMDYTVLVNTSNFDDKWILTDGFKPVLKMGLNFRVKDNIFWEIFRDIDQKPRS